MIKYYKTSEWNKLLQRINNNDPTLTVLDLSHNGIDGVGVETLCKSLKNNHTLVSHDLNFNQIEAHGAESLAEAVKNNNTLLHIKWRGNYITLKKDREINDLLRLVRAVASSDPLGRP